MLTTFALIAVVAFAIGAALAWIVRQRPVAALEARVVLAERESVEARTRLESERAGIEQRLSDQFQQLAQKTLGAATDTFLVAAKATLGEERAAVQGGLNTKVEEIRGVIAPVQAELAKFQQAVSAMQVTNVEGITSLKTSLEQMTALQGQLQQAVSSTNDATGKLRAAFTNPTYAGSWGEISLDRIVEMAGMTEHCDFDRQVGIQSLDGTHERPDLTIRLTGNLNIPVDAKASVVRYLEACEAVDDIERDRLLRESAQTLRVRVRELQSRGYNRIPGYAGMTFLFVPNESMLSAALAREPKLVEEAAAGSIVICSPLLLLCYLHAFARGWSIQKQQDNADEVARLGARLHDRIRGYFASVGALRKSIELTVRKFNESAAKMNNLLVPGRELGRLIGKNDELASLDSIDEFPRAIPYDIPKRIESAAPVAPPSPTIAP